MKTGACNDRLARLLIAACIQQAKAQACTHMFVATNQAALQGVGWKRLAHTLHNVFGFAQITRQLLPGMCVWFAMRLMGNNTCGVSIVPLDAETVGMRQRLWLLQCCWAADKDMGMSGEGSRSVVLKWAQVAKRHRRSSTGSMFACEYPVCHSFYAKARCMSVVMGSG
jgi:hypothetical protein